MLRDTDIFIPIPKTGTPEGEIYSRKLQELYLALGYIWHIYDNEKEPTHLDKAFIVLRTDCKHFLHATYLLGDEKLMKYDTAIAEAEKHISELGISTYVDLKPDDRIYVCGNGYLEIKTIDKIENNCAVFVGGGAIRIEWCCLATMENYQRLIGAFPKLVFEKPTQILKGSHATIHILKNQRRQICYVGDQSDFKCRSNDITELAVVVSYDTNSNRFLTDAGEEYRYAVPVDGNDNSIQITLEQ